MRFARLFTPIAVVALASCRAVAPGDIVATGTLQVDEVDIGPIVPSIEYWFRQLGIGATVQVGPYGQVMQELVHPASGLATLRGGIGILVVRVRDWLRELPETQGGDFSRVRDILRTMAGELVAAVAGSMLARGFFGVEGNLAATQPQAGMALAAAGFEVVLTFGMVLLVLSMANGPKLNGPFIPLAVGAYVMSLGTMGGPFQGAAMNPARAFGPDVARGDLSTWWVYVVGPVLGALIAVLVATILRGPAKAQESQAAMGTPLGEN